MESALYPMRDKVGATWLPPNGMSVTVKISQQASRWMSGKKISCWCKQKSYILIGKKDFILSWEATQNVIGGELAHHISDGKEQVMEFVHRKSTSVGHYDYASSKRTWLWLASAITQVSMWQGVHMRHNNRHLLVRPQKSTDILCTCKCDHLQSLRETRRWITPASTSSHLAWRTGCGICVISENAARRRADEDPALHRVKEQINERCRCSMEKETNVQDSPVLWGWGERWHPSARSPGIAASAWCRVSGEGSGQELLLVT